MTEISNSSTAIINHILQTTFQQSNWIISHPSHGQQKECYIARNEEQAVFIKFDVAAEILQRLSSLEVAPEVLGSGTVDGRSYILQKYLDCTHPQWTWFADHLSLWAQITKRYHTDPELTRLLPREASLNYYEHVLSDLGSLKQDLTSLHIDRDFSAKLKELLIELELQSKRLPAVSLAPVHADPNPQNILLCQDTMVLADWDEILLSDPMRDVGQWLCWYVPKNRWKEFCESYGILLDQHVVSRIFWWAARASFANVLWHVKQNYDYTGFLRDCADALRLDMIPHQVFS
ncbi:MAG TPA: phosphotransferase [Ktedonobacteraceae bacterium]|nr:phosphotransferase [Ktedonobacteraceae bacterium]